MAAAQKPFSTLSEPEKQARRAFFDAAWDGNLDIARAMLKDHPDAANWLDESDLTPLCAAISEDRFPMVELLLDAGADINHRGLAGNTPLMTAIVARSAYAVTMTQLLLSRGADPSLRNDAGKTAAHYARVYGMRDVEKLLLEKEQADKAQARQQASEDARRRAEEERLALDEALRAQTITQTGLRPLNLYLKKKTP